MAIRENVRRKAPWILPIAILAVVVLAVFGWSRLRTWWNDRTPYSATAMNLHLSFSVQEMADQQAALDALGPDGRKLAAIQAPFAQFVVGRLDFTQPAHAPAGSQYALFIINRRTNTLPTHLQQYLPGQGLSGGGYDGRFTNFANRYPWLSATAEIELPNGGGWTDPGTAITFVPGETGPILFTVALDPVTDPSHDLTIVLGFIADDGHVFWAQRLSG